MRAELLVIMAKYPTPGKVKTRLAAEIGAREAARLYRSWLEQFATAFAFSPFDIEWRYTPATAPFRKIIGNGYAMQPQPAGDLGDRMSQSFRESFTRGYERVVMIGTDAPEMDRKTVQTAFRKLRAHRAVLQPTDDGGYALVGLSKMAEIFMGIDWSTDRVMAQTRALLKRKRIKCAELSATFDVDTAADLARLRNK